MQFQSNSDLKIRCISYWKVYTSKKKKWKYQFINENVFFGNCKTRKTQIETNKRWKILFIFLNSWNKIMIILASSIKTATKKRTKAPRFFRFFQINSRCYRHVFYVLYDIFVRLQKITLSRGQIFSEFVFALLKKYRSKHATRFLFR